MDRKIDFFIIGAQKAGTTALFHFLGQHQNIFVPRVKELVYFARDEFYRQGEGWLDPYYSEASDDELLGAAYVHMMYFTYTADRLRDYNPQIRAIAVVRNPIDRAYSAYWFARRNGWEPCDTFEEAIEREPERRRGSFKERAELTYLSHGYYAAQLTHYMQTLGRERIRVILNEDLAERPHSTFSCLLDWLGVEDGPVEVDLHARVHSAGMPRFPWLHRFLLGPESGLRATVRRLTSPRLRHFLRTRLINPLLEKNIRPFDYPEMDPATRARLVEHFAPHNESLSRLIGTSLDHWR